MLVYFLCGNWCGVQWAELLGESIWGSPLDMAPVRVDGLFSYELSHTLPVRWAPLGLAGGLWRAVSASYLVFSQHVWFDRR